VTLRSDSRLLIEQMAGRFKVKNARLRDLHREVQALMRRFDRVVLEHVPRGDNAEADALANEGVDDWLAAGGEEPDAGGQPPLFDG
jgi:probable phosphoglycerate mutase